MTLRALPASRSSRRFPVRLFGTLGIACLQQILMKLLHSQLSHTLLRAANLKTSNITKLRLLLTWPMAEHAILQNSTAENKLDT